MRPYPMIYLDYNATPPLAAEAREAMLPFLAEQYGSLGDSPAGASPRTSVSSCPRVARGSAPATGR